MRYYLIATAAVLLTGAGLALHEHFRLTEEKPSAAHFSIEATPLERGSVRAAGRVQGATEEIELRARLDGQIEQIHVIEGQRVSKGDVLLSLDDDIPALEAALAAALYDAEQAQQDRLENGALPSELETARQEYLAAMARVTGAESSYNRAMELTRSNAVSKQDIEDLAANLHHLRALAAAAKGRFETLSLPPRKEDLRAAKAAVRAAEARLQIARTTLEDMELRAPTDGEILWLGAEVGELASSESEAPLIRMSDTSRLLAVAEIDEFDALRVQLGQTGEIRADGAEGVLGSGKIIRVAPQMTRKQLFGNWAEERSDTLVRRVWIDLQADIDLPIGLPIDVYIYVE